MINSLRDGIIAKDALSTETMNKMNRLFKEYLEDIMGLSNPSETNNNKLSGVMELLIDIRREARSRKDYATSDKIRNELAQLGILLKDEKDGSVSWGVD